MASRIDESIILKMQELERNGLSHSEIANLMGKTKNSVTGALYRRKNKIKSCNPHKGRATAIKNTVNLDMPITKDGITIFELKNSLCRAMIGHHKYCGHTEYKRSYCEKHFKEYHQGRWNRA